jgi:putative membrane-bound dehydrogenase-like protein
MMKRRSRLWFVAAICASCVSAASGQQIERDFDWQTIQVPGIHSLSSSEHIVWYRSFVRVPKDWVGAQGVSAESITILLEGVTDAAEIFINGTRIGRCGSLPPDFEPAGDELFRLKIPPDVLKKDQPNVVAIRLYARDKRAGFSGRAPVLAGYHNECVLAGEWEFHAGDIGDQAFARIDARPTRAVFDRFRPATTVLRPPAEFIPGQHLSPSDSLQAMRTFDDLQVDLVLAEPEIAQPLSFDFDARGRLWVVEYRQYPYPAGLTMVSRDKFYRSTYDQVPAAPPHHVKGADRISIHEDTDGDGDFDVHKTFVDGLSITTSIEIANGGVWVLNPPYLLFYADMDHNDVPDGDPEVVLEGFGLEDTHSVANSLTWGPDGWLYGAQGSTTSSRVRVHGNDKTEVYRDGAMIWRYHPATRRYEIFAEGGGNAFGIEIDAQGRLFSGHNGDHTRGFHYEQGAYSQKGTGDKYGPLSNPHAYGHLMYMSHAPTPRFSHDLVKYEENGLPDRYRGKLFAIDPLNQNIVLVDIIPRGTTFRTRDEGMPLTTSDLAFRPVDIASGPDGAIYVADFCEEFIAHGQHYQGQIDRSTGRVYRIRAKDPKRNIRPSIDLRLASSSELVKLLGHASRWHRRTALRLLAERNDRSVLPDLIDMVDHSRNQMALEALWAIHLLDGLDDALAVRCLKHPNPHVRRWTVRLVADRDRGSPDVSSRLSELARREEDPEVRSQLACSAKRLPTGDCLSIVRELCVHDEDAADPFQPLLVWWAVESKAGSVHDVLQWFRNPDVWQRELVRGGLLENTMRRFASGSRNDLEACATLLELAPDAASREKLLAGFERAFRGRTLDAAPERLIRAMVAAGGGSVSLRMRQGDKAAIQEALDAVRSDTGDVGQKVEYAKLLGEIGSSEAVPVLLGVLQKDAPADLLAAALASLQSFDDESIAPAVLARLNELPIDVRPSGLTLLASRTRWARLLLAAIDAGTVRPSDVPPDVVQQISLHNDQELNGLVQKLWPSADTASREASRKTQQRATMALQSGDSDPYAGSELYVQSCAKCHLLFRRGGNIGPDLTSYRRSDVTTMLLHVVNPGLEIREGYETWSVVTNDGRVVSGFLFDQDAHVVVIRGADGQNVAIPRADIDQMNRLNRSIMPDGLLDSLSDQQIRDLFAFLRLSQPLNE